MWSADIDRYPVLTRADRRRLAFGEDDAGNRTRGGPRGIDTAWEALPGCRILTRSASTPDGRRGWVIVPDAAATAIGKRAVGDNRRAGGGQPVVLEGDNRRIELP